ncbi:MAG: surface-adhesin E family protein [bacterium]
MRTLLSAALLLGSVAPLAQAQKWKDIGITSSGNVVSIDPKSVKRTGDLVSATVRVVFKPPVKASRGTWASSRITADFDCKTRYLASKGSTYYSDEKGTKVVERSVIKMPGFGPGLSGSLGGIAVDYLCGPKK